MAESYQVATQEGLAVFITPDISALPLILNPTTSQIKIGTGKSAQGRSSSDSVMPAKKTVSFQISTTTTIDLTAAPDPTKGTNTVDCSTYYLLDYELKTDPSNAALINVAPGGANPFPIFGTGNDVDILPGKTKEETTQKKTDGTAPAVRGQAVDATHKTITFTITGTDIINVVLVFGQ